MSTDTQERIRTYEQLPDAQRHEVADFARFLLAKVGDGSGRTEAVERWLDNARGSAKAGVTTDQIMDLTRGDMSAMLG
jgi:hypothetical protein